MEARCAEGHDANANTIAFEFRCVVVNTCRGVTNLPSARVAPPRRQSRTASSIR